MMTVPPQLTSSLPSFSYPASFRHPPPASSFDMCFQPQRHTLFQHLNLQKCSGAEVLLPFLLGNMLRATTLCTFSTSQRSRVLRTCIVLNILTWKWASRHNAVHFFIISTSKSGPNMWCFCHFDFEMYFAHLRANGVHFFEHLNFQKCSEPEVF